MSGKKFLTVITFLGHNKGTNEADEEKRIENLLYVHQEKWQAELLMRYGNSIVLMDATYKTTKYEIPLFFISVKNKCWLQYCG